MISTPLSASGSKISYRPMGARATDEPSRAATPLELLFDLTFVAAVSQLAARFAHGIETGNAAATIGPFMMVFFAIWWAWMNFTWFASAYDCDDLPYRLAVLVQLGGVVVLAAGIGRAFDDGQYGTVAVGYLVMRLGLVSLWLRAAVQHPSGRRTALWYAAGVVILEALWIVWVVLDNHFAVTTFVLLAGLELLVPVVAESRGPTSWNAHHIAERYSLFVLILLGEGVFAATRAVVAVVEESADDGVAAVAAAALVVICALWWLYFGAPSEALLRTPRPWSFGWGYAHYILFGALAALGAGLEVVVATSTEERSSLGSAGVVASVAVPVAVVVLMFELFRFPTRGSYRLRRLVLAATLIALGGVVIAAEYVGVTAGVWFVALILSAAVAADSVIK